jgi:hypothetical protein
LYPYKLQLLQNTPIIYNHPVLCPFCVVKNNRNLQNSR